MTMKSAEPICSPRVLDVLISKVHQHLGPDFSGARSEDLLRRLKLLALELEVPDLPAWLEALAFAEWDSAQVQELTPAFTVGETYFRRDAEAFDWLAQQHLRPLLEQRRREGRRGLRLWSAACCTGEEAYSLLFLLDDLLATDTAPWSLDITASDINAGFLARAQYGSYGKNAFRSNEEAFRVRYFQPEGRLWRVRPQWRGRIRFIQHNLVGDPLPSPVKGMDSLDLILCRNVLMYFSPERALSVLRRLLACLAPDGLLLLSAVEASIATQAGFNGFWAGCNYALSAEQSRARRGAAIARSPGADVVRPQVPAKLLETPLLVTAGEALPQGHAQSASALPEATSTVAQDRPAAVVATGDPGLFAGWPVLLVASEHRLLWQRMQQAQMQGQQAPLRQALLEYLACVGLSRVQKHQICLLLARSWADQHCSEEAEDWLRRALALEPCSAPSYWLQALLAEQKGASKAAHVALQKALYLDPDFILAHFHQSRLLWAMGAKGASDKALHISRQLLERQPQDAPVPFADGLSCAQLLRLCEQLQEERTPCSNP
ncbi:CheR family methyltransferase [Pseudomonas sp.]|uniref:CheR family methyltransferase n=1 Tax=Pseudomonas sp. TaxID=306 RepID=UPI003C706261